MQTPHEKLQRNLQLIWEANRLRTFKKWPFDDNTPCSAAKLAEAGFYFTGTTADPDSVQCFLCDKALDGWDEQDDPWEEHFRHSGICRFAQLKQPENALTFQQMKDFKVQLINKEFKKFAEETQQIVEDLYNARLHKLKKTIRSLKSKMVV